MNKFIAILVLTAACGDGPSDVPVYQNRASAYVKFIEPNAECYPVATGRDDVSITETAYCVVKDQVLFCKAPLSDVPTCTQIGRRNVEKSTEGQIPTTQSPVLPAAPK